VVDVDASTRGRGTDPTGLTATVPGSMVLASISLRYNTGHINEMRSAVVVDATR
jgi:hypothetical protein